MNPAALPCHWDTGNLGTHGKQSRKEVDPFQMVDDLTARETQWGATTRLASMDLENVQEFLRLSLEKLGGLGCW